MGLFQSFNISASGMTAQRFRTDIIAENIANVNTTSTAEGGPYRRKVVTFSERNVTPFSQVYSASKNAAVGNGVKVKKVTEDYETEFVKEYDPESYIRHIYEDDIDQPDVMTALAGSATKGRAKSRCLKIFLHFMPLF